ncbi:efflux RND transporter permease subunit, partial [Candidatus Sumerlaeota bacterium]|nr:efflux RND transporter permease subunit [Candidatus Sumerlaeota bacterium]
MKISEYSVKNPVTTLMAFLAVLMVGIVCIWQLPVDLFPEMELPVITVMTQYEGAAPQDVEEKVTKTLERFLSTVPDLKHITSRSKEGISIISLSFEWGTNLDARSNDVRDSVGMSKIFLPEDIDEPRVLKMDVSRFPIMVFGVTARESYPRLEEILDDEIIDPIKRLPGVGSAAVMTPLHRQVNVDLDRERLAAYNLTPLDIARSIVRENEDTPAGNIKMGLTDYLVRVPGQFKDVAPMREIVLASRNGSIIRLSDVGTVEDGFEEITRFIAIDGNPGGVIMVQKQSDANTVQVARLVRKRIDEYKKRLPEDIRIIPLMDSSEDIIRSIKDLWDNLLVGGILTILVVWIFLRRFRATIIISLTIPFSLILAVVMMFFLGYTINMMSLFGMIIAVGMIVDNAIVILENITRHREEGQRPREGAIFGASEVGMAITASTLTTVCIFFPILFVKGVIRIFFTQFAVIVIIVIMGSLFSALTLTPMLSSVIFKNVKFRSAKHGKLYSFSEKGFQSLSDFYGSILMWALYHRKTIIFLSLFFFAGSLLLVPFLGTEFMPEQDQAGIQGTLYLPVGARVEETSRVLKEIEKILMRELTEKERVAVFTRCGTSREGMGSVFGDEGMHIGAFGVKLVPRVERSRDVKEIAAELRKRIDPLRGELGIEKYMLESGDPMAGLILGGEKPLTVNIIGDDLDETDRIAARISEIAKNTPGTVDITISRQRGRPELWVNVNRAKASASGLNVSDV